MLDREFESWIQQNKEKFSGEILFSEPLSKHTYYRIGGPARVMAIPKSLADLHWLRECLQSTKVPFFILGQGSNILASDAGFDGLIIRTHRLNLEMTLVDFIAEPMTSNHLRVRTGASVAISTLLRRAAQEGWGGLEFLTGIPGSVSGAVYMNAGTHLGETQTKLRKVQAYSLLEGLDFIFENDQLAYQYRKNLFLPLGCLIYAAEWEVHREEPARVKAVIDETLARRKASQPIDFPSCGSVFKNPKASGISAWQVIDRLGLRGYQIGGAQFSEKHSNFIINLGQAKACDVKSLIDLAKARALAELGIPLEEEVIWLHSV